MVRTAWEALRQLRDPAKVTALRAKPVAEAQ
jgi:hypothetical protein